MQPSQIRRIIEVLESARTRKQMYFQPVNVEATVNFLNGFKLLLFCLEMEMPHAVYAQVYQQRGWEYTARGVWIDMQERQMTEESIIDELLTLEIQAWKSILDNSL